MRNLRRLDLSSLRPHLGALKVEFCPAIRLQAQCAELFVQFVSPIVQFGALRHRLPDLVLEACRLKLLLRPCQSVAFLVDIAFELH